MMLAYCDELRSRRLLKPTDACGADTAFWEIGPDESGPVNLLQRTNGDSALELECSRNSDWLQYDCRSTLRHGEAVLGQDGTCLRAHHPGAELGGGGVSFCAGE